MDTNKSDKLKLEIKRIMKAAVDAGFLSEEDVSKHFSRAVDAIEMMSGNRDVDDDVKRSALTMIASMTGIDAETLSETAGLVISEKKNIPGEYASIAEAIDRVVETGTGSIKIEITPNVPADMINRLECIISELSGKVEMLMNRLSGQVTVKPVQEAPAAQPKMQKSSQKSSLVVEAAVDKSKRNESFFAFDFNHVATYVYNQDNGTTLDDVYRTFARVVATDMPERVWGYMYASSCHKFKANVA